MRYFLLVFFLFVASLRAEILIPMDEAQTDHLKAYGIVFKTLKMHLQARWLLNYRGGSWLLPESAEISDLCNINGVAYENVYDLTAIMQEIEQNNMDVVVLEKEPKIAVYTPPLTKPWDDAVTMALSYAGIEYDKIWDPDVLGGKLNDYDWLHLHHEDFTGQYGKFYASYATAPWYVKDVQESKEMAAKLGYSKVWQLKHAVAEKIREYVQNGGFLFAMCAATDTIDIALAFSNVDIAEEVFDDDGVDPNYASKANFGNTFAFKDFNLLTSPFVYEFSDIDVTDNLKSPAEDFFTLFDFSAKYDPVPTMLTQNHVNVIDGFMGQTTAFHKDKLKDGVIVLGQGPRDDVVKYLHGNLGKGTFTFYGGHDPEDYAHKVGDPETVLSLHKHSPGYRLILNNVLFPAAEKKKLKT